MIRIKELRKSYGMLTVLDGVSLDIHPGQVTALLGPNGAGKTTLIKSLMGLVRPDAGTIFWKDAPLNDEQAWKSQIGYMPQHPKFPENLRVNQVIKMLRALRQAADADMSWLDVCGLDPHMNKLTRELSGGNRQKLNALVAFMFRPEIYFLDEPTAGMDPITGNAFMDRIIEERAAGRTIILTSHVLSEVEQMADRIVYLIGGRVVIDASLRELIDQTGTTTLQRAVAARLTELSL